LVINVLSQKKQLIFNSADCSSHPAEITASVEPIRQPDCTYRVILKWSVNYDIDILESLNDFSISLYEKDDLLNIASPFGILANNIVCFGETIDNIYLWRYILSMMKHIPSSFLYTLE